MAPFLWSLLPYLHQPRPNWTFSPLQFLMEWWEAERKSNGFCQNRVAPGRWKTCGSSTLGTKSNGTELSKSWKHFGFDGPQGGHATPGQNVLPGHHRLKPTSCSAPTPGCPALADQMTTSSTTAACKSASDFWPYSKGLTFVEGLEESKQ